MKVDVLISGIHYIFDTLLEGSVSFRPAANSDYQIIG